MSLMAWWNNWKKGEEPPKEKEKPATGYTGISYSFSSLVAQETEQLKGELLSYGDFNNLQSVITMQTMQKQQQELNAWHAHMAKHLQLLAQMEAKQPMAISGKYYSVPLGNIANSFWRIPPSTPKRPPCGMRESECE